MTEHKNEPIRVLIVDDDEVDRIAIKRALAASGIATAVDELDDAQRVAYVLEQRTYDCVLLDYVLGSATGLEVLQELRAAGTTVPIVALTGHGSEQIAVDFLQAGADDYLAKHLISPERLGRRVRNAAQLAAARRAKVQAERSRDDVLSIVSHDLRGPLSQISIAVDELASGQLDSAETARYIGAIRRGLRRAQRLVHDLLDAHRIESGTFVVSPRNVDAYSLLLDATRDCEMSARKAGVAVELAASRQLGTVWADRGRMLQVLTNLIGNAIRHTPKGGRVTVDARPADDTIQFRVLDTGPGIAADVLPNIFDRNFRARDSGGGAGLGLAIAKGIVEAHGGRISAAGSSRSGAELTFELPRRPKG